jgi:hypothetical protein
MPITPTHPVLPAVTGKETDVVVRALLFFGSDAQAISVSGGPGPAAGSIRKRLRKP